MQPSFNFEKFASGLAICKNDPFSTVLEANEAFYSIIGYTKDEFSSLFQNKFSEIVVDDLTEILKKVFAVTIDENGTIDYEYTIRRKDGMHILIHDIASYDREMDVFHVVIMDISEKETKIKEAYKKAHADSLTGLLNRSGLESFLEDILKNKLGNTSRVFFVIDLDNFKEVNDRYGHPAGDEVLRDVGARLRTVFRHEDMVGRLGGDEFAAFVSDITSQERIEAISAKVVEALSFTYREIEISCSVGAFYDSQGTRSLDEIYASADNAMYKVKSHGKNSYVVVSA